MVLSITCFLSPRALRARNMHGSGVMSYILSRRSQIPPNDLTFVAGDAEAQLYIRSNHLSLSRSHALTFSRSYNFANRAWKNLRYFGSGIILRPLILFLCTNTFSTDSAITSMCACVYTRRGMVSLTSSNFG